MNVMKAGKTPRVPSKGILWLVVISAAVLPGLARSQTPHVRSSDTLAVVGREVITVERFAGLYKDKLLRFGLTDNTDTRRGYLGNLVDDEILIARARDLRLDRTPEALKERKRFELQELLNAFSDKHISATLQVTDDDLVELYRKANTRIHVRHLYARTKSKADTLYQQLTHGKSFAELARQVFTDPRLKANGGSLGYITFDEMDPAFERTAYAMHVGETSEPVKTVQGYSIIRVEDIQPNPFITESEFAKAKEKLKIFARKRKYEDAVTQYSAMLRSHLRLAFNEPLVSRLFAMTQEQSRQHRSENESFAIARHELRKPLLSSTQGIWTVRDVIEALSRSSEGQRKWIHTSEQMEDFIAGLFLRDHIAGEARREHLGDAPSFRTKVDYAFGTYLLTTLETRLRRQIHLSQDSLQSYYAHNRERFRTQPVRRFSSILVDNAQVADSLKIYLESGVSFGDLVRRFSIQKATAENGGDLGFWRKEELGSLGPELFALAVGEWKGPFVDVGKYLFVMCTGREDGAYRSFEESSNEIEKMLVTLSWQGARHQHVETWKKRIQCEVYPERLTAITLN